MTSRPIERTHTGGIVLPGCSEAIATARRFVRHRLRADASAPRRADVVLAASELMSSAIVEQGARRVRVSVAASASRIDLAIDALEPAPAARRAIPGGADLRRRVAASVCDRFGTSVVAGEHRTSCSFDLPSRDADPAEVAPLGDRPLDVRFDGAVRVSTPASAGPAHQRARRTYR